MTIYREDQKPKQRKKGVYLFKNNLHPITGFREHNVSHPSKVLRRFSLNLNANNGFRSLIV